MTIVFWILIAAGMCAGILFGLLMARVTKLERYCKAHSDWHAANDKPPEPTQETST